MSRDEKIASILDEVLSRITPSDEEEMGMERVAKRLLERIDGFL